MSDITVAEKIALVRAMHKDEVLKERIADDTGLSRIALILEDIIRDLHLRSE